MSSKRSLKGRVAEANRHNLDIGQRASYNYHKRHPLKKEKSEMRSSSLPPGFPTQFVACSLHFQ